MLTKILLNKIVQLSSTSFGKVLNKYVVLAAVSTNDLQSDAARLSSLPMPISYPREKLFARVK